MDRLPCVTSLQLTLWEDAELRAERLAEIDTSNFFYDDEEEVEEQQQKQQEGKYESNDTLKQQSP